MTCWKCGADTGNETSAECAECASRVVGPLGAIWASTDNLELFQATLKKFGQANSDIHAAAMDAIKDACAENRRLAEIIRRMPKRIPRHPPIKPSRK